MRYTMLVLFLLALVFSLRRPVPEDMKDEPPMRTVVKVLIGFLFGGVAVGVLRGREVPPNPIELAFPLRGGAYLVEHGGSTGPSNMHNAQPAQRFAVDLVKLNGIGMRARGIYPSDVTRYAIYGAEVFSPCSGVVVSAFDGLPDTVDDKRPFGNHVVVRCHGVHVTLAHLQKGSVAVKSLAPVTVHQLLGRAGNSGLSAEPHLHVHAERGGAAVPVRFDGRWLVRNDVIR
jgi:hypothetical protein